MTAFVIGLPSVTKTITVKRPGRDEESFTAEIRVLDMDEQDALQEKIKAEKTDNVTSIKESILSLGGFSDAEGNDLKVNKEMHAKLLKDPYVWLGLVRAYNEVQRGIPEATAKN